MKTDGLTWINMGEATAVDFDHFKFPAFSFKPGGGERHHGAVGALLKIGQPVF